ncbi:MAG: hypothetical protein AABX00_05080 [Nanoarchaeota archaeon]
MAGGEQASAPGGNYEWRAIQPIGSIFFNYGVRLDSARAIDSIVVAPTESGIRIRHAFSDYTPYRHKKALIFFNSNGRNISEQDADALRGMILPLLTSLQKYRGTLQDEIKSKEPAHFGATLDAVVRTLGANLTLQ